MKLIVIKLMDVEDLDKNFLINFLRIFKWEILLLLVDLCLAIVLFLIIVICSILGIVIE